MLAKILQYNDLFEKGLIYINSISNDHYLEDIAEKNGFNNGDDFLEEINQIWYETYRNGFLDNNNWSNQIERLSECLEELKKTCLFDRKLLELNDRKESKKLLDSINDYVEEINMYYDNDNKPIYDVDSTIKIIENGKNNLLNAKGKKNRKEIYNQLLLDIESTKYCH